MFNHLKRVGVYDEVVGEFSDGAREARGAAKERLEAVVREAMDEALTRLEPAASPPLPEGDKVLPGLFVPILPFLGLILLLLHQARLWLHLAIISLDLLKEL